MPQCDRELQESVGAQQRSKLARSMEFAERRFDCDLPRRGRAHKHLRSSVRNRDTRLVAQASRIDGPVNQYASVEQEPIKLVQLILPNLYFFRINGE